MLIRLFRESLKKRPFLTHVVASGVISGGGDIFSQVAFEKRNLRTYDFVRTARFVVLATCFIAPSLNVWFRVLERVKGDPKIVPLKRLAIDQAFFAPPFNGFLLFVLRMLEGIGVRESYERMKDDWWIIYTNSLKIWPTVQLVNFYLIPLNMRVIVVQVVAFFWNTYLSYRTQAEIFRMRHSSR